MERRRIERCRPSRDVRNLHASFVVRVWLGTSLQLLSRFTSIPRPRPNDRRSDRSSKLFNGTKPLNFKSIIDQCSGRITFRNIRFFAGVGPIDTADVVTAERTRRLRVVKATIRYGTVDYRFRGFLFWTEYDRFCFSTLYETRVIEMHEWFEPYRAKVDRVGGGRNVFVTIADERKPI